MLSVLIGVLIICVVGAICFWAIEKFVNDRRLANLLKLLVALICVGDGSSARERERSRRSGVAPSVGASATPIV